VFINNKSNKSVGRQEGNYSGGRTVDSALLTEKAKPGKVTLEDSRDKGGGRLKAT